MILSENLKKNNIILNPVSTTRWEVIKELVSHAVKNNDLPEKDQEKVANLLIDREKAISTGIGNGVAIPHCTLSIIENPVVVIATTEKGISFDSIDNQPVKIIILLLVPKNKLSQHVKTLTNIAKIMNDNKLKEKILSFKTSDSLFKYLKNYEPSK